MKYFDFGINKNVNFKKAYFFVFAMTAVICSRVMFVFIDDPEGPNLLVVLGFALIIYFLSLAFYIFNPLSKNKFKNTSILPFADIKIFVTIVFLQIIFTILLYFRLL